MKIYEREGKDTGIGSRKGRVGVEREWHGAGQATRVVFQGFVG